MRYVAPKGTEVSWATREGEVQPPISFKTGSYTTNKSDEIALLDELATTPNNPIGFDPKEG